MEPAFNPLENFSTTRQQVGYVERKNATDADYRRIGFKSGLEVHQQLKTREKLFCRCPAGRYFDDENFEAEIIRHMRPALSELGQYDGTALMEFKTRKNIFYRISNETACTYEIDDTPPFKINREALDIALEITLLSKLNVVGEVHITRKQYLDGSIPTGFQRTAILGVEGEINLRNKKVGLIQLSIEEDSCREVSDIGHNRIYKTDRLGMPLIETVTKPELLSPDELMEAAEYIRFLNRSTGKVRTGIGAGREDVNVSCQGGTRVEIKGVSHNRWIPALSHNEAFRQWALLHIRELLLKRMSNPEEWKMTWFETDYYKMKFSCPHIHKAFNRGEKIIAVNLPMFKGVLSHFTQPSKPFYDELINRLKVIACIEKPNMICSEDIEPVEKEEVFELIRKKTQAGINDAQIILWGPEADIPTAVETVEERCRMAFAGVPSETRKPFPDGTTVFERVLPGADRMYPDTDSAPIPLEDEYIERVRKNVPTLIHQRYEQLVKWKIPADTYTFILSKNLFPVIEKMITELEISPRFAGTFMGQTVKNMEGRYKGKSPVSYNKIYKMFEFLTRKKVHINLARYMLPVLYSNPSLDFESVLETIKFRKRHVNDITGAIENMNKKFDETRRNFKVDGRHHWIMGQLRHLALGNMPLTELSQSIDKQ